MAAGALQVGDRIRTANGGYGVVEAVVVVSQPQLMYNLSVDEAHTYLVGAGRWLVHNSCDYRETFFKVYPHLRGQVVVHHAIEQQVLRKYPGLFTEAEIHALNNLRGIPLNINSDLHLSKIRKERNKFYKANPTPSRQDIIDYAAKIDKKFGKKFVPKR